MVKEIEKIEYKEDVDMGLCTSFKTGGEASLLVCLKDREQLKKTLKVISDNNAEFMVIGNGSNLLFKDGGYKGVVIKLGETFEFTKVNKSDMTIEAGASTLLSVLARKAEEEELSGLEFASGIPGTVGGALFMNAGAYDGEMSHIVKEAKIISKDGVTEKIVYPSQMELSYRKSIFQKNGDIITSVTFQMVKGEGESISEKMRDYNSRRNEKQPMNFPSAGSFFKRPEGNFAGKLISDARLKGLSLGGAQVSELHAGFIINKGDAKASDIIQLMKLIQNTVYDKFGVKLETEVRIIGED